MSKINCWEFKNCGREPDGAYVHEFGVCPASTESRLDGVHGGKNAGRACWVIAGSLCGDNIQGRYANKMKSCKACDFYQNVKEDEIILELAISLLSKIQGSIAVSEKDEKCELWV
jgi:hypothetical protein